MSLLTVVLFFIGSCKYYFRVFFFPTRSLPCRWEPYKRSLKYGVTLIPNSILLLPFAAVIVWLAYKFVEEKMSPLQKIQDDSVGVVQVSDWKCPEKKKVLI